MSHWYYPNGLPCTEVLKKDGKGTKKPDINSARELGLFAGVTSYIDIIRKFGLEIWMKNQVLEFAWKVKRDGLDFKTWKEMVLDMATTEGELAADTGTDIGQAIEDWIQTGKIDTNYARWVDAFSRWWIPFLAENSPIENLTIQGYIPTDLGYAGKYDIRLNHSLIDVKTQNTKGKGFDSKWKPYSSWGWQLIAYADAIKCTRIINFVVDSQNPDFSIVHEWPKELHEKLRSEFNAARILWLASNDLTPKAITKEAL